MLKPSESVMVHKLSQQGLNLYQLIYLSVPGQTTSFDGRPFLTPFQYSKLLEKKHSDSDSAISETLMEKTDGSTYINNTEMQDVMKEDKSNNKQTDIREHFAETNKMDVLNLGQSSDFSQHMESKPSIRKTFKNKSDLESKLSSKSKKIQKHMKNFEVSGDSTGLTVKSKENTIEKLNVKLNFLCHKRKIVNTSYDPRLKEFIFDVESGEQIKGQKIIQKIARAELIKTEPLLLLNFYEKHIQFSQTPDFDPKLLANL